MLKTERKMVTTSCSYASIKPLVKKRLFLHSREGALVFCLISFAKFRIHRLFLFYAVHLKVLSKRVTR